jgi:hypothetical protein
MRSGVSVSSGGADRHLVLIVVAGELYYKNTTNCT